ncbi:DMT family transporter [Caldalkalibacillus salinus]|uniref:DMT family transporter n=1 Tax=Caldalkalibacillus salinus TaxID=2803787 RepID=UPI0019230E96|nr:DMT family transporter [Caldalkalibacillus salinus]
MPAYLYGLLMLLSLIWGASFFFIKVGLESFGPIGVAFWRCLFGAVALAPILIYQRKRLDWQNLPWGALVAVGLLNSAIPWMLLAYSETKLTSSFASVLNASTPIWTLIIGIVIFRLKSTLYQWLGILVGFIGIIVLMDIDWSALYVQDSLAVGAMVLVTLFYGFSSQLSKRTLNEVSVYQIACLTLVVGALATGVMALAIESNNWGNILKTDVIWNFIGLGSLGSGIAYILFFKLVQKGSAELATMVTYLVPPFAILWGYFLLNEAITPSLLIGLLLILSGVYLSTRKKKNHKSHPQTMTEEQAQS